MDNETPHDILNNIENKGEHVKKMIEAVETYEKNLSREEILKDLERAISAVHDKILPLTIILTTKAFKACVDEDKVYGPIKATFDALNNAVEQLSGLRSYAILKRQNKTEKIKAMVEEIEKNKNKFLH